MTKTFTTLTAAGALCVATFAATPARAMDPWTAAAWFAGGVLVAGLLWAPYAYGAPTGPYGYAGPYGYGGSYGYAGPVGYASTGGSCYPAQVLQGGVYRQVRVCY